MLFRRGQVDAMTKTPFVASLQPPGGNDSAPVDSGAKPQDTASTVPEPTPEISGSGSPFTLSIQHK